MLLPAWSRPRALLAALAFSAGAWAGGACGSVDPILLCGEIPVGGCPVGRGGSCTDVVCAGLYDCVGGHWTLSHACAARDGGLDGTAPDVVELDAPCTPVSIDAASTSAQCPGLELPDCPVEAAQTCAENACKTECIDFFVCQSDGSLLAVAHCDAQGHLVVM